MREELASFMAENKIEYYAALSAADVRIIRPHILERSRIEPRSLIIYLIPYFVTHGKNLSSYATSLDYHIFISSFNSSLLRRLSELRPGSAGAGFGDISPIDERLAAARAGLGMLGRNGLLINEKYGSYIFIGEVLTDIPPEELGPSQTSEPKKCENCGACLSACPTGVLSGKGNTCLSAVTQRKGELTDAEKDLMIKCGSAWGCDICQDVCPHNLKAVKSGAISPIPFFRSCRVTELTRDSVEQMSDDEFSRRAFAWKGRAVVYRNIDILSGKS